MIWNLRHPMCLGQPVTQIRLVEWSIELWHEWFRCDMTHPYATLLIHIWHDSSICDMTHPYATLLIQMWHDFQLVVRHNHAKKKQSHATQTKNSYVTWLIHMRHYSSLCDITFNSSCDTFMTHTNTVTAHINEFCQIGTSHIPTKLVRNSEKNRRVTSSRATVCTNHPRTPLPRHPQNLALCWSLFRAPGVLCVCVCVCVCVVSGSVRVCLWLCVWILMCVCVWVFMYTYTWCIRIA